MPSPRLILPVAVLLLAAVSGCAGGGSARMIQSTRDGGIVAIPSNSNSWPNNYRDHAERLMAMKCPEGYEIVSEQEVVVGQKAPLPNPSAQVVKPAGYTEPMPAPPPPPQNAGFLTRNFTITSMKEYWITFRAPQARPTAP
jgi:hypothetical protein